MSDETICRYTHDVTADRFDDIGAETWYCPYEQYEDTERCVFHQPIRAFRERDVTAESIGQSITELIESGDINENRLLGATLPGIELEYEVLDGDSNHPIDLRESWILGPINLRDCRINNILKLNGADFESTVVFEGSTFEARASFSEARFHSDTNFNLVSFEGWADFKRTIFYGEARFRGTVFETGIFGIGLEFRDAADFMSARFDAVANLYDSTFEQGGLFASTTFRGDAKFTESDLRGPVMVGSNFVSDPSLEDSELPYDEGRIKETCLVLSSSRCVGNLQLNKTTADATISILDMDLEGDVQLRGMQPVSDETITIDFRDVDSVTGIIEIINQYTFDFTGSVVGDVEFENVEKVNLERETFRFKNTIFDGFDFGAYKSLFQRLGWQLHSDASPTVFERENTYLRAKNGAIAVGENAAAREFHFNEMLNRGYSYRRGIRGGIDTKSDDPGLMERLYFTRKWISNQVLRYSCGYGERPGRVIYSSIAITLIYGAIYAVSGVDLNYQGLLAPIAFSFQAYNAIVLGIPEVNSSVLGVIVASEAFIGPFFIALFVFSITQSLGR